MSLGMAFFISGLLFGIAFGAFLWIPYTLHCCGLERRVKDSPNVHLDSGG